jgi:Flavin containing amine oxidoreductase
VFAPLYQVLRARGVRFRFCAEVEDLVPAQDGSVIGSVVVRQRGGDRDPLLRVQGLPCFRAGPEPGRAQETTTVLRGGTDFDQLVFAIPPAMARTVAHRLVAQRPQWRAMVDRVASVPTHAFQLWLTPDERALGWAYPGTTVSAFAKPFDTWASMSHLIGLEDWAAVERPPATLGYFCSTLSAASASAGDAADHTRAQAVGFLERYSRHFWPNATDPASGGLRWDLLCADEDVAGPERFATQYWTANTDPSDRYVQSLPGTDQHRLRPDRSGYANLHLAGDWTDCGINAGCIEAAVVSGLQAANGLLGRPRWDRVDGRFLRS